MNNKGQLGVLSLIFGLIMFIILWVMFFAGFINEWSQQAITSGNVVGLEAFLLSNVNLWIAIGLIIGVLAFLYMGNRQ